MLEKVLFRSCILSFHFSIIYLSHLEFQTRILNIADIRPPLDLIGLPVVPPPLSVGEGAQRTDTGAIGTSHGIAVHRQLEKKYSYVYLML